MIRLRASSRALPQPAVRALAVSTMLGTSPPHLRIRHAFHSSAASLSQSPSPSAHTATSSPRPVTKPTANVIGSTAAKKVTQSSSSSTSFSLSAATSTVSPSSPAPSVASVPSSIWSDLYLPVKPPSSAPPSTVPLPVQHVKPPTPSSLASLTAAYRVVPDGPTSSSYASRPLPRLPLLLLLLLSVPGLLFARDDWRARLIAAYPTFPWPHWMRVEATRLDRLSLEERRRRGEHIVGSNREAEEDASGKTKSGSGERRTREAVQQMADTRPLEEALQALRSLQSDSERWSWEQESPEQREARERKESQKQSLLASITALEGSVRDEMRRQQDEVSRQVSATEAGKRAEFVGRLEQQAADITHRLADSLNTQRTQTAADQQRQHRVAEAEAVQRAREEEVSRGVQRITARLQQQEGEAEAFVRRAMEQEERRLLDAQQAEAHSKDAVLQWAGAEEQRLVRELEDAKQLHYVSANLHRLRLLLSSVDELLHRAPASEPKLWLGVWQSLRAVGADDPVIATAAQSISDATLAAGVQPFDELQATFKLIERPLRAATLTSSSLPPAAATAAPTSLPHHLLASLLSPFLLPQHALVGGADDSSRLSRACFHLYRAAEKDIARCVAELGGLQGVEAREAVSDWLRQAADRAAVEQAASMIGTRLHTLELSLIHSRQAAMRRPERR